MKIKINSIQDILKTDLSLEERGILITILLVQEKDSKKTLAKFKTKVKMSEITTTLIRLQNQHLIEWSGYEAAVKRTNKKGVTKEAEEVIEFMNKLYGTKFKPESKTARVNIENRLHEFSIEECKIVVANRWSEWRFSSVMKQHLNPHTIFRPSKFEKYLEEANRSKQGVGFVKADSVDLKPGQEITYDVSKTLIDDDIYVIRIFSTEYGKTLGAGREFRKRGKDIKLSLKVANNNKSTEEKYIYTGK